jgi:hypothetical protein
VIKNNSKNMEMKERDKFIIERFREGIRPDGIVILLKQHGFKPVSRPRVYQILEKYGIIKKYDKGRKK